jgi:hypothetical protein
MNKQIIYLFIALFFIGCGGGSGSSSSSISSNTQTITGVLIDSTISGVTYTCDTTTDITSVDGKFTCPINSTVIFNIGGVKLGSIKIDFAIDNIITPAKLYGLKNNNITDIRVLNFIQFVQSLDSDNNATNGIDINSTVRESLLGNSLDISDANTTQNELNATLNVIGKNLISQNIALQHYIDTLKNDLNITLKSEPYYYQQWYLDKNITFYTQNNINENANIHSGNLLKNIQERVLK